MSRKKGRPRRFSHDAIELVRTNAELSAQHARLTSDGYVLATSARCYRLKDRSITVQLIWTRRWQGGSHSHTTTIRGLCMGDPR